MNFIEKRIPQGTMRPIKKLLGVLLGISAFGMLFKIDLIIKYLTEYQTVFVLILIASSYLLWIAGRRN